MGSQKRRSFRDIVDSRQHDAFVGRDKHIAHFRENLALPDSDTRRMFIYNVFGQGGVGKSTLLKQYRMIAENAKAVVALVNEDQKDILSVMERIAQQFEKQQYPLKSFDERYREYRQKRHELEADPDAPRGIAEFVGRTIVKGGFGLLNTLPFGNVFSEIVDQEAAIQQGAEFADFIVKKFKNNKADIQLVQEPLAVLTPLFLADLNTVSEDICVVLLFDVYEVTGQYLDKWLRNALNSEHFPVNFVLVIAGRLQLDQNDWVDFKSVMVRQSLEPFSEQEAKLYLERKGITDERVIKVILKLSGRLPLLLAILVEGSPNDPKQIGDLSGTAVERFLKWVEDTRRRELAVNSALPRRLNLDVVAEIVGGHDAEGMFAWLKSMPFVEERDTGWIYHSVVRDQMVWYKLKQGRADWEKIHDKLAQYYEKRQDELELDERVKLRDEQHQVYSVDIIYHRLCQLYHKYLMMALNGFLKAVATRRRYAKSWAEAIQEAEDALEIQGKRWGQRLLAGLHAYEADNFTQAAGMYTDLLAETGIEVQMRAIAFNRRGRLRAGAGQNNLALADFSEAIRWDPENPVFYMDRGIAYFNLGKLDEALYDCTRAIELEPKNGLFYHNRSSIYNNMKLYGKALEDIQQAITYMPDNSYFLLLRATVFHNMGDHVKEFREISNLIARNPKDAMPLLVRAICQEQLKRYDEALEDYTRAVEIEPENVGMLLHRAKFLMATKQYREALEDYNHAVEVDPKNVKVLLARARCYEDTKDYTKALEDYDRAVEIDSTNPDLLYRRSAFQAGRYCFDKALADISRAITLKPDSITYLNERCKIYLAMKRFREALTGFNQIVNLSQKKAWRYLSRAAYYANRWVYDKAFDDIDDALKQDPKSVKALLFRGSVYSSMHRYGLALQDFDEVLTLEPTNVDAILKRANVYAELEYFEKAEADYTAAISIDATNMQILLARAELYQNQGQYDEALEVYTNVIELAPYDVEPLLRRAACFNTSKQFRGALEDYNRAVMLDPYDTEALRQRASFFETRRNFDKALEDYNKAIDLDSNNVEMLLARGAFYTNRRNLEKALKDFDTAHGINPYDPFILLRRGILFGNMERNAKALEDFKAAIDLDSTNMFSYIVRGKFYNKIQRYDEALKNFDQAILLNPYSVVSLNRRAEFLSEREDYNKALEDYRRCSALMPTSDYYNLVGLILCMLGEYQPAMENFQRVLQKDNSLSYMYNVAVCLTRWKGIEEARSEIEKVRSLSNHILEVNRFDGSALYALGGIYAVEGDAGKALQFLNGVLELEDGSLSWTVHDAAWNDLRDNPRFQEIVIRAKSFLRPNDLPFE